VRPCIGAAQSSGHRGLFAHWRAHRGVELPTARRRSAGHELTLVAPPDRLAIDQGGAPFLAEASSFTL
jgi:hypothetical protein